MLSVLHTGVVVGESQSGKSSIINKLLVLGARTAKEGMCCCEETKLVEHYVSTCEECQLVLYDTPDCCCLKGMRRLLVQIALGCQKVGLSVIVCCFKMTLRPLKSLQQCTHILKMVHSIFGPEVWRNIVLILTFANNLTPPYDSRKNFNAMKEEWKKMICLDILHRELEVPMETVEGIPLVPAGYTAAVPLPDSRPGSTWLDRLRQHLFKTAANSDPLWIKHHCVLRHGEVGGVDTNHSMLEVLVKEEKVPMESVLSYNQVELLRELLRLLDQNHVTGIWRNLAQELGFLICETDELSSGGPKVCLEKVLEVWLNWAPPNH